MMQKEVVEKSIFHLIEYLNLHKKKSVSGNMNIGGTPGEDSKGNEEHVRAVGKGNLRTQ